MNLFRVFTMPNLYTFSVPKIMAIVTEEMAGYRLWADPFAGQNSPATIRNDMEASFEAEFHLDGLAFLQAQADESVDGVLFDPPYSVDQALRFYKPKHGGTAGRAEYHARCKDEIARIVRPGGKVISFGWDSNGTGMKRRFAIESVYLLNHGALHNDTIVTVDRKLEDTND